MTETYKIDLLRMYFGEPYQVTDEITLFVPTIQDIMDYGEDEFFSMLNVFIGNTTSYRLPLWNMGIDWNKISDYELFANLIKELTPEKTAILFGDLDFSKFNMYKVNLPEDEQKKEDEAQDKKKKEELHFTLYDEQNKIELNENAYNKIALYIRTMFNMFPKVEKARGRATKEALIWEDEENLKKKKKDGEEPSSIFLPLISACVNHPGFKYKKNGLREVGVVEFMDSVQRLQIYESTTALLKGMYSGFVDVKGIPNEEFNFMRELKTDDDKYKNIK